MRSRLLSAMIGTAIGFSACTVAGEDAEPKIVLEVKQGMNEQQVRSLAGPPSEIKLPGVCGATSVRELLYHSRTVWLGGLFEGPTFKSAYVCLDDSGKVIERGSRKY